MRRMLLCLWGLFFISCIELYAYDFESGGICYNILEGNSVEVTEGNYSGEITIPEIVVYDGKNYSVTSIGFAAFRGCSGLTSITIPNSVTSIGYNAFENCSGLTSITIPNSVTSIGFEAFYRCCSLTSVTIPNSVTSIGHLSFYSCSSLTSITIPNSVTSIGEGAFRDCSGLASIEVEIGNTRYDSRNNCNAIIETSSKTLITGCKNTIIPNSVTVIESYAFDGCSGLTSITIPISVAYIGYFAFRGCSSLTSITIPHSVTKIYGNPFSSCSGLTSIIVESGNTNYNSRDNCNAIIETSTNSLITGCKNTIIPGSVTSIGNYAFDFCTDLTSITIPNSVTSIGSSAFYDCSGLTSITISNFVKNIGDFAFSGCSGLTDVISQIQYPFEIKENVFSSYTYTNAKLTVPAGTKSKYKATNGWKNFTNIEENRDESELLKEIDALDKQITELWGYIDDGSYNNITEGKEFVPEHLQALNETYKQMRDEVYRLIKTINYLRSNISQVTNDDDVYALRKSYYEILYDVDRTLHRLRENIQQGTFSCNNAGGCIKVGSSIEVRNESRTLYSFNSMAFPNSFNSKEPDNVTISVVADEGYKIKSWKVNGQNSSKYVYSNTEDLANSYVAEFERTGSTTNIVVTVQSCSRKYGDANPSFSYSVSGGTLSGKPQITCEADKNSPVGTYTINITKGSVTNSNVTFVNGTLTITKAPLTITAKDYTRKQGEPNPTFDVTYSGFKNGETKSVLTTLPKVTTTATTSSPVGTYALVPSGAEAQNYSMTYVNGTLTVTEESQVTYTYQNITYTLKPSASTAEVQSVDNSLTDVVIPNSVSYNSKNYSVTSIASGALSNRTFNYVSLPSSITSINDDTFSNSMFGALIWNANTSLSSSSSVFTNMAMSTRSNFLLYVKNEDYAPSNVKNVVVGTTAISITLADGANTMFYCPKEFTAQNISYTHNYSMETGIGGDCKGWETICLPFTVTSIKHEKKGELTLFANYDTNSTQRPFWLYEYKSSGFAEAGEIKANTPYLISMPNNSAYNSNYILAGDVTFSAKNATVPETSSQKKVTYNGKSFVPTFSVVTKASNVYALNVSNSLVTNTSTYNSGSRFISNLRNVYPFEAYFDSSSSGAPYLSIEFDGEVTDIPYLTTNTQHPTIKVYNMNGQLLFSTSNEQEYQEKWQLLPSGVYIVNGRKTIR